MASLADAAYRAIRLDGDAARRHVGKKAFPVMSDESLEGGNGKARKRPAAKLPIRQPVSKVKSTIHLSLEASQRLDIHCTMMGFDRSEMVEKLINDHLRRYVVSDRGGSSVLANNEDAA